ncbi:MAG: alanine--tRNA ligase [Synechococcus sp. SB0672_bin_6]|nr:alanine--tRNA ligase [Synechococcus sp. SB0672_bin_6]
MSAQQQPRSGAAIRLAFLDFYTARGHRLLPSASLVPEDPTVLLTIAGMLPFKPVFLGQKQRPAHRATSAQKCIRTNDIENVGRTARHHTFFEMLGNFSFGDYFKEQAICWAWELSTEVFDLDPRRLVVSVFREDEEASAIWTGTVGVDPRRVVPMGEADNFWSAGPTGPCGPCSELYYDLQPGKGDGTINLEDDQRFIEFYNLVFMESNRDADGVLTPLANRNIDTGMGLERMARILQGKPNNYETDLIYPLMAAAARRSPLEDYFAASPAQQTSFKIIADHSRAVTHLIADGVTSSNLGRGYVLRRLIRRAVRHGHLVGIREPFLESLADVVIQLMESAYPRLRQRQDVIKRELQQEELRFRDTLERGEKRLGEMLTTQPERISGSQAFELYDTHGFPLELTVEIAQEHGLAVDQEGFATAMEIQRQQARAAAVNVDLTCGGVAEGLAAKLGATPFSGYQQLNDESEVVALVVNGEAARQARHGDAVQVGLSGTCFYGESGGQVGDRGLLLGATTAGDPVKMIVEDVQKVDGFVLHKGRLESGVLSLGQVVTTRVDRSCRRRAQIHHTATHLLHEALKRVVDPVISQAGSLVDFDRLRFDFNCSRPVTASEMERMEALINGWILDAQGLEVSRMSMAEAKARGAVAMFGEKYGDVVRVVNVPGVSMELCGGTHVNNTAEIGVVRLVAESGVASGIRRIEAVAGPAALAYIKPRDQACRELGERFKAQPTEIVARVEALQAELKHTSKALAASREALALAKAGALVHQAQSNGPFQLLVQRLDGVEPAALQTACQALVDQLGAGAAVILAGESAPGKVSLVAGLGPQVVARGLKAGALVGALAKKCGGGGGGRPNLAQAGGRQPENIDAVLKAGQALLAQALSQNPPVEPQPRHHKSIRKTPSAP